MEASTGKSWHTAVKEEFIARNAGPTGFFAFSWDGVTTGGKKTYVVRNGHYVARVSALKALGDAANPAHWESWTSPEFVIAR